MSLFFNAEDGFYTLTTAGIIAFIVLAVILLVLAAFILSSNAGARLCDILCAAYQDAMGRFGNTFFHALYNPYRLLVWT